MKLTPRPYHAASRPDLRCVVRIPALMWDGDEPRRRFFRSEAEAVAFCRDREKEHARHGVGGFTGEDKAVLSMAKRLAGGDADKLLDILRQYARQQASLSEPLTIGQLCERFLAHQTERLNPRTVKDDAYRLRRIVAVLGRDTPAVEVRPADIQRFLDTMQGANARNFYKCAHKLFSFAFRRGLVASDPLRVPGTFISPPAVKFEPPSVIHPAELETILRASSGVLRTFYALKAFRGFRTRELVRAYSAEETLDWSDFDWKQGLIHVRREVAKSTKRRDNERWVELDETTLAWLPEERPKSGRVVPCTVKNLREQMIRLFRLHRLPMLAHNVLRHSFASHFLAAYPEKGAELLSQILGDSEQTARSHYLRALTPAQGRKWMELRP